MMTATVIERELVASGQAKGSASTMAITPAISTEGTMSTRPPTARSVTRCAA